MKTSFAASTLFSLFAALVAAAPVAVEDASNLVARNNIEVHTMFSVSLNGQTNVFH